MRYRQNESRHIYNINLSKAWNENMTGSVRQWGKEAHLNPHGNSPNPTNQWKQEACFWIVFSRFHRSATDGTELTKQNLTKGDTDRMDEVLFFLLLLLRFPSSSYYFWINSIDCNLCYCTIYTVDFTSPDNPQAFGGVIIQTSILINTEVTHWCLWKE